MNLKKIVEVRVAQSRMPWSCAGGKEQTLVLDGGERVQMADRHLDGIVPVVGDWLIDGRVFQHYLIAKTELSPNGQTVLICDLSPTELNTGLRVGPAELNPSGPVPQVGDYLIRKTDGYHVISRRAFEDEYCLILAALKKRASDSLKQPRSTLPHRRSSNRRAARA